MPSQDTPIERRGPKPGYVDPRTAQSRKSLIESAAALLVDGGVAAVSVEAVVATSGVSRATLYRHFDSVGELAVAAFSQLLPPISTPPTSTPLRDALISLLDQQADLISKAPYSASLVAWAGLHPPSELGEPGNELAEFRLRLIERYRTPFFALLNSEDAGQVLSQPLDQEVALAQLVGPLVFRRVVMNESIDSGFCASIVDDFLKAHAKNRPRRE
jgi:AcrR family transcriptional regulator